MTASSGCRAGPDQATNATEEHSTCPPLAATVTSAGPGPAPAATAMRIGCGRRSSPRQSAATPSASANQPHLQRVAPSSGGNNRARADEPTPFARPGGIVCCQSRRGESRRRRVRRRAGRSADPRWDECDAGGGGGFWTPGARSGWGAILGERLPAALPLARSRTVWGYARQSLRLAVTFLAAAVLSKCDRVAGAT